MMALSTLIDINMKARRSAVFLSCLFVVFLYLVQLSRDYHRIHHWGIEGSRHSKGSAPIHLVYASDNRFRRGTEASIRSAIHFASEALAVHYIGEEPLLSFPEVDFINLTTVASQYKLQKFTNPRQHSLRQRDLNRNIPNYARFVIHSLLPDVKKAMYVDSDTLFQCDVVPMVRSALTKTDHIVAAVPFKGSPPGLGHRASKVEAYKNITTSFNAGIYVVDLERWRSNNVTEKILDIAIANRKEHWYRFGSQQPLALLIGNDFEHLKQRWNQKATLVAWRNRVGKKKQPVCLIHWAGHNKPWNKEDGAVFQELWARYDKPKVENA